MHTFATRWEHRPKDRSESSRLRERSARAIEAVLGRSLWSCPRVALAEHVRAPRHDGEPSRRWRTVGEDVSALAAARSCQRVVGAECRQGERDDSGNADSLRSIRRIATTCSNLKGAGR